MNYLTEEKDSKLPKEWKNKRKFSPERVTLSTTSEFSSNTATSRSSRLSMKSSFNSTSSSPPRKCARISAKSDKNTPEKNPRRSNADVSYFIHINETGIY